jgi:hypothetical protein
MDLSLRRRRDGARFGPITGGPRCRTASTAPALRGSRFVPPVEAPKRVPKRSSTGWLSRANVLAMAVHTDDARPTRRRVNLEGGIQPKTAPPGGG